jgi:hypothetical protein
MTSPSSTHTTGGQNVGLEITNAGAPFAAGWIESETKQQDSKLKVAFQNIQSDPTPEPTNR